MATGVCEEMFNVNSKIAQTTQNIWNLIIRKSNLQEMANFGDYPGDFRLQSGDREKRFKFLESPGLSGRADRQPCHREAHMYMCSPERRGSPHFWPNLYTSHVCLVSLLLMHSLESPRYISYKLLIGLKYARRGGWVADFSQLYKIAKSTQAQPSN